LVLLGALRYPGHASVPEIHRTRVERGVSISQRNVTYLLERYDELVALSVSRAPERCERLQAQGRLLLAIDGGQSHRSWPISMGACSALERRENGGDDRDPDSGASSRARTPYTVTTDWQLFLGPVA
jgi:hypothetical protein